MRRPTIILCCTLLALVLLPATAFAHASFDLGQVPAESEQALTLRVPIERDAANDRIAVLVPTGFEVVDCAGAEGWDCGTEPSDDGTVVSLMRTADDAGTTEQFDLTLAAPSDEGVYAFPVVQTYDDDEEVAWVNEPGSDRPAPRLQVGDSAAEVEQAEAPTHTSPDDATGEATPEPTAAASPPGDPTPTEDASSAAGPTTDDEAGGSSLLLVLVGVAVALAVVAAVAIRQRSGD